MTRTPDEIKKGLECCTSRDCGGSKCPYFNEKSCNAVKSADALSYIQQLEEERDAAVADLRYAVSHPHTAGVCYACKHHDDCQFQDDCDIMDNNHWEWRGVQKEE